MSTFVPRKTLTILDRLNGGTEEGMIRITSRNEYKKISNNVVTDDVSRAIPTKEEISKEDLSVVNKHETVSTTKKINKQEDIKSIPKVVRNIINNGKRKYIIP